MNITSFDQSHWTGRLDKEDGELGIRIHQIIKPYQETKKAEKVFVGFCSEEGVKRNKGRVGAKQAPNLIRQYISNLPVHFSNHFMSDYGNIEVDQELEAAREKQIEVIKLLLEKEHFPIVLGGGHETALGDFLGFISKFPSNSIVINLDAHFDLRLPVEHSTSGTPFYEMQEYCKTHNIDFNYLAIGIQELGNTRALFQRADQFGVNYILADEIHLNFNQVLDHLKFTLSKVDHIYLTLDMDVFDVAYAPGVSAPTINGLTPFQVKYLLKFLKQTGKVKLFDIVEVNPSLDRDFQTSKLAAQSIYEFLRD